MEKLTYNIGNKIIVLSYKPFDTDLDIDDLTSIHYENIYGEIVTVSTLLNKIGLFQSDVKHAVKNHDLELSIYKARLFEMYRKKLTRKEPYVRGTGFKVIEPGNTELENAVYLDEGYQLKYKGNLRMHRDLEYIESLYWSIKNKSDNLKKAIPNITPEEFQSGILEGTINTIFVKKHKNVLPNMPKL